MIQRRVGEHVHDFVDHDAVDLADHACERERQDVARVSGVDTAGMEGTAAVLTRLADLGAIGCEVTLSDRRIRSL